MLLIKTVGSKDKRAAIERIKEILPLIEFILKLDRALVVDHDGTRSLDDEKSLLLYITKGDAKSFKISYQQVLDGLLSMMTRKALEDGSTEGK